VRREVFDFDTQQRGSSAVVALVGELDVASVEPLRTELERLRAKTLAELLIDLSELEFIDSTGLALLLRLRGDCARSGTRLRVVAGPPAVQRLFAVTGTLASFDFARSEAVPRAAEGSA
jgi:anti-sigma B factor antagonist